MSNKIIKYCDSGYYYDEKGNRAWVSKFTTKRACLYSLNSLSNCDYCENCVNCKNCVENCECYYCNDCFLCDDCNQCNDCSCCKNCSKLEQCEECLEMNNKKLYYKNKKIKER